MAEVRTLFSETQVAKRVYKLAEEIAVDFSSDLIVISLLKGSFVFTADLIRAMHCLGMSPKVEFISLSSYGKGKDSTGNVVLSGSVPDSIEGKEVLIVDDILDTGHSMVYAKNLLTEHGVTKVSTCVLLDKLARRMRDITADYTGFLLKENLFVVGYGIDYADDYRYLPYIGAVD